MKSIRCKRIAALILAVLLAAAQAGFASGVDATLKKRMSTRTGPGTKYTGCGAYFSKGHEVEVISLAYDRSGRAWLQVEFEYHDQLRRAYTGLKRVNVNIDDVPMERELGSGTMLKDATAYFGPGSRYAQFEDRAPRGVSITAYGYENGYYLVEFISKKHKKKADEYRRCWVTESAVSLDGSYDDDPDDYDDYDDYDDDDDDYDDYDDDDDYSWSSPPSRK